MRERGIVRIYLGGILGRGKKSIVRKSSKWQKGRAVEIEEVKRGRREEKP